ncbi:MAG: M1 family metallopeptidase [Solirubrobacteraceae bacterium]
MAALALGAAPAGADIGAPGLGDPLFPLAGNGGYDVAHYGLTLDYDRASGQLGATAVISARATQSLTRFDLDLRGFDISLLFVDGRPASYRRAGQELIVTPREGLRKGRDFTVIVRYAGVPEVITDPDESIEGWVPTADGAFVVGEPQGAPGWFPSNDNPQDKATFDEAITVPDGITALGNGVLVSRSSHRGRTTWVWHESDPMATYLATATNGRFALTLTRVAAIPVYNAVDPALSAELGPLLDEVPDIVRFFSALYGPYPFNAAGAIVDDAPDVGYALESQTKPNFAFVPDETTLVHELAHQWFGDAVTLRQWPDIWLHEGFAEWSEWIWSERHGGPTAQDSFDDLVAENDPGTWDPAPGLVTDAAALFSDSVYDRGAMTLQALRVEVGDATFFRILRDWFAEHKYANATTPDFIALAQRDSHRDLHRFFAKWLYTPGQVERATAAPQPAAAQALAAGGHRRR